MTGVPMKVWCACVLVSAVSAVAGAQDWNRAGLPDSAINAPKTNAAPAPRRDIGGIWDAGGVGVAGPGHESARWTDWAQQKAASFKPGNGPSTVHAAGNNRSVCNRS